MAMTLRLHDEAEKDLAQLALIDNMSQNDIVNLAVRLYAIERYKSDEFQQRLQKKLDELGVILKPVMDVINNGT